MHEIRRYTHSPMFCYYLFTYYIYTVCHPFGWCQNTRSINKCMYCCFCLYSDDYLVYKECIVRTNRHIFIIYTLTSCKKQEMRRKICRGFGKSPSSHVRSTRHSTASRNQKNKNRRKHIPRFQTSVLMVE